MVYAPKSHIICEIHENHCILKYFEGAWPATGHYTWDFWLVTCFNAWRRYFCGFTCYEVPCNIVKSTKARSEGWDIYFILVLYNRKLGTGTQKPTNFPLLCSPYATSVTILNPRLLSTQSIMCTYHYANAITCCHCISSPISETMRHMLQRAMKNL